MLSFLCPRPASAFLLPCPSPPLLPIEDCFLYHCVGCHFIVVASLGCSNISLHARHALYVIALLMSCILSHFFSTIYDLLPYYMCISKSCLLVTPTCTSIIVPISVAIGSIGAFIYIYLPFFLHLLLQASPDLIAYKSSFICTHVCCLFQEIYMRLRVVLQ
jgi:hypothetical protein